MYTEKELVGIAKRENNNKRKYLVVNRLQGKHIPVSPKETLKMFDTLADCIKREYQEEKILIVGFAETATAIGAALAIHLNTYYMQTTREDMKNVEYLFFSESHSHATEQKLIKTDLDIIIDEIDRIIFAEDEVTTGNTILNIINIIEKEYSKKLKFSVASLLNGMNEKYEKIFDDRKIRTHYLVKTNHDMYTEIAESYEENGTYHMRDIRKPECEIKKFEIGNGMNARRLHSGMEYWSACGKLWEEINEKINVSENKSVLVVGTEEFMYPALFVANKIEEKGNLVRCHATTRSPIAVSSQKDYPLHARYELVSLYDKNRKTFLYDIDQYDEVMIITDSEKEETEGIYSLVNAICSKGNNHIYWIRWCKYEKLI